MPSEGEQQNLACVRRLCSSWPKLTRDEFAEVMTPGCRYINIPWPDQVCTGPNESFDFLRYFQTTYQIEIEILREAVGGDVVMSERLETIKRASDGVVLLELPVTGVFVMQDGKIAEMRDYFDSAIVDPIMPS
jgi:limonene-1,2-epoxide hydrolase